jgi:hypothetical protein
MSSYTLISPCHSASETTDEAARQDRSLDLRVLRVDDGPRDFLTRCKFQVQIHKAQAWQRQSSIEGRDLIKFTAIWMRSGTRKVSWWSTALYDIKTILTQRSSSPRFSWHATNLVEGIGHHPAQASRSTPQALRLAKIRGICSCSDKRIRQPVPYWS